MKRHLSALMLALRSTIYRAAALAILAGAAQAALFLFAARRLQGEAAPGLEEVFAASFAPQGCAVFFLLLCALLCFTGCNALAAGPGIRCSGCGSPSARPRPGPPSATPSAFFCFGRRSF